MTKKEIMDHYGVKETPGNSVTYNQPPKDVWDEFINQIKLSPANISIVKMENVDDCLEITVDSTYKIECMVDLLKYDLITREALVEFIKDYGDKRHDEGSNSQFYGGQ